MRLNAMFTEMINRHCYVDSFCSNGWMYDTRKTTQDIYICTWSFEQ